MPIKAESFTVGHCEHRACIPQAEDPASVNLEHLKIHSVCFVNETPEVNSSRKTKVPWVETVFNGW